MPTYARRTLTALTCALLLAGASNALAQGSGAPPPDEPKKADQPAPSPTAPAPAAPAKAAPTAPPAAAAAAPAASAAPAGETPLDRFRQQMIELDVSAWTGLKLVQNGKTHSVSVFGSSTANMLASSPAAADAFSTYRTLRISGTILYLLGTSALVATLVILAADRNLLVDNGIKGTFWGLFIPGTVVGIAGGIMLGASSSYVAKAVRAYNEDLYQRLRRGAPRAWMLRLRQRF